MSKTEMKSKHVGRSIQIALGLLLIGLVVVPFVLRQGRESLAQTAQTTPAKDKGASQAAPRA